MFRGLWGGSAAGVSQVTLLAKDKDTSAKILKDVFAGALAADAYAAGDIIRTTKPESEVSKVVSTLSTNSGQVRVDLISSDERIAQLIEVAIAAAGDEEMPVLVSAVAQSSKDYLEWAKEQCVEMELPEK